MSSLRTTLLVALFLSVTLTAAVAVPANFTDLSLFNIGSPTSLNFTPDGRMLITRQSGSLRVYQGGTLLATPAITLTAICTSSERGLLGVAVDPNFSTNHYIYLYYTFNKFNQCPTNNANDPVNRVSRFTLPDSNIIDPASELVLVDNMPSPNGNHNAGDLQFGKDGYLYISIGDGGCDYAGNSGCAGNNDAARDQHVLTGKVLRIATDGSIPASNPFQGAGTARCNVTGSTTAGNKCQETFAWGLRNPFRIAMDPNAVSTRFFINDVGQDAWEEIDLGQSGADYGWNCREGANTNNTSGPCSPTPAGMIDPIFQYQHNQTVPGTAVTGCNSVTGGAFVPNGIWPGYDNTYLFSDYVCGAIFVLTQSGPSFSASTFASGLGGSSAVDLRFGPYNTTQALYYTTYASGGQVHRVTLNNTSGNNAPTATATASPQSGGVPLNVSFDATGSSDPDAGDTLTYFWDFGDGATAQTATVTTSHNYTQAGVYNATLRARDNHFAFSNIVTMQIQPGNTPPVPTMTSPAAGSLFRVGQTLTLSGSATDTQDGSLPASSLSWTVLLHHNTHTHPYFGPSTGTGLTIAAPAPEDLAATQTSYLEVYLTATDSKGLTQTLQRNINPRTVTLSFDSLPSGRSLSLNGSPFVTPFSVVSWDSWGITAAAADQSTFVFGSWSDRGAATHSIITPATAASYLAYFNPATGLGYYVVTPCRVADTRRANGPLGGPVLTSGSRDFDITGVCGVPAAARSVAVNVAVIPQGNGYLLLHAAGEAPPPSGTVTINLLSGKIRSNNSVISLNDGSFSVYTTTTTDLIVDVVGYFQ